MSDNIISCVSHGAYGVDPEKIPLCPECDQPMWVGEQITLQTCDVGPGEADLVRLIHSRCEDDGESDDAESEWTDA
jgi:hypothetical protein